MDSLGFKYTKERNIVGNLAKIDFESFCVPEVTFRDPNTSTCSGKYVPTSVSNPFLKTLWKNQSSSATLILINSLRLLLELLSV